MPVDISSGGSPTPKVPTTAQRAVLLSAFKACANHQVVVHMDAPATPERKPEIDWVVRQFSKIDIQVEVRATDNNQFQDKVRKGKHQIFWSGWNADYPDAENFL